MAVLTDTVAPAGKAALMERVLSDATLKRAEGRVPHPLGEIVVRLVRTGRGGFRAEVTLPAGIEGVLVWNGKEIALRPGRREVSF